MKTESKQRLALLSAALLTVTGSAWSHAAEDGKEPGKGHDAPLSKERRNEERPQGRFKVGTVIPPHIREELRLSDEQAKKVKDLEAEVKEKLSKILSEDQQEMFGRPPIGPGGPPRGFDRRGPGGPGRGPEGHGPDGPPRGFDRRGPGGPGRGPEGHGPDGPPRRDDRDTPRDARQHEEKRGRDARARRPEAPAEEQEKSKDSDKVRDTDHGKEKDNSSEKKQDE